MSLIKKNNLKVSYYYVNNFSVLRLFAKQKLFKRIVPYFKILQPVAYLINFN